MDRDFRLVQSAYAASGKPENAEFHHYPKFADKAVRKDVEHLDEGLDSKTYFETVNVDPPSHYLKRTGYSLVTQSFKVGSGILIGCDFLYNMGSLFFI